MSNVFVGYIYDKRRFSARFIAGYWANVEPCIPNERLVQVAVSPRVEAVFYFGTQSLGRSLEFGYGCEALIRDGYAGGPARKLLEAGNTDFQYAVWVASEISEYDVSICYSGNALEGRAMIRGQAERVSVENNSVQYHEVVRLAQSPQELGMVVDGSTTFDEEEYQRRLTEKEEPFRPGLLVHDEIGVPRGKVMDAQSNAQMGSGTVLWPEGGPVDTPEMRRESLSMLAPNSPTIPIWAHLVNESATMSARMLSRRRRKG
ncbi:MAG: hypothetical protein IPM54_02125 [Polyangiaceae bacterium]|nr:hypothetical protein [Polyangiaceae bacterium]